MIGHSVCIRGVASPWQFRFLVKESRAQGRAVLDRCNLTVLLEPGQEDLADFLSEHKVPIREWRCDGRRPGSHVCRPQVQVVASLPCYDEENVKKQRGGKFALSCNECLQPSHQTSSTFLPQ
jgi:hypothetical protein